MGAAKWESTRSEFKIARMSFNSRLSATQFVAIDFRGTYPYPRKAPATSSARVLSQVTVFLVLFWKNNRLGLP